MMREQNKRCLAHRELSIAGIGVVLLSANLLREIDAHQFSTVDFDDQRIAFRFESV